MSDTSPILSLPFIQPAQAQKHITHNEALRVLDAVVQLVVIAVDQSTPPASPTVGDCYIVAAPGNGDWLDRVDNIAIYEGSMWRFVTPQPGWQAQVLTPKISIVFDATAGWETVRGVQSTLQLGINAVADVTNRLSLSSEATLFNHEGAGHQLKLNKATATDTASLLYQSGFSGRAEVGLAGEDAFSIKVSADGAGWIEALRVAPLTGTIQAPQGIETDGPVTGSGVQQGAHDTMAGRLLSVGAFGWGQDQGGQDLTLLNAAVSSGVHQFNSADPDKPFSTGGSVLVIRYAHQWLNQIAFAPTTTSMWLRQSQNNGVSWGNWLPLTPNRGSNASGTFTQFSDGTMICTHRFLTSAAGTATWVFPSAFVAADACVSVTPQASVPRFAGIDGVGQTDCTVSTFDASGAGVAQHVFVTATGRWI